MAAEPSIGRATEVERTSPPEADAARALFERHAGQLYGFCLHRLGSREEAEDALQTTFLNAFRGLRRGVVPEAEAAWLFKIAENVCLTRRRSAWRRGRVESPSDMQVLQEVTPARQADRGDELIPLGDALAAMPENQRRAILLREWQGLSYKEISAEMDVSQSAVETLIFRARRSLANALETPWEARRSAGGQAGHAFNLASLLAWVKTLFAGGAAAKVAVVAVAATGTAALAVADRQQQPVAPQRAEPPAAVADGIARGTSSLDVAQRERIDRSEHMAAVAPVTESEPRPRAAAQPAAARSGRAAQKARSQTTVAPALSAKARARKTPPGHAKEPRTPASDRARPARPEPKAKPKTKPAMKSKSQPKAKPTSGEAKAKPAPAAEASPKRSSEKPEEPKAAPTAPAPAAPTPPPAPPAGPPSEKEKQTKDDE